MEVAPPSQAARVQLVRASTHSLELSWTSIPNATNYLLEVQKLGSSVLPSNATLVHPVSMLTKDEDDVKYLNVMKMSDKKVAGLKVTGNPNSIKLEEDYAMPESVPDQFASNSPIKVTTKAATSTTTQKIRILPASTATLASSTAQHIRLAAPRATIGGSIVSSTSTIAESNQRIVYQSPQQTPTDGTLPLVKKQVVIIQPKKTIQFGGTSGTVVSQSNLNFKMLQQMPTVTANKLNVIPKPQQMTPGSSLTVGNKPMNVVKLMPGSLISGNKIIMKNPSKPGTFMFTNKAGEPLRPGAGQQLIVVSSAAANTSQLRTITANSLAAASGAQTTQVLSTVTSSSFKGNVALATAGGQQIKIRTVPGATTVAGKPIAISMPMGNNMGQKPLTIGGRTVTLQLAGQKKVTLMPQSGIRQGTPSPKIIMVPSGARNIILPHTSTAASAAAAIAAHKNNSNAEKFEQLDGAFDVEVSACSRERLTSSSIRIQKKKGNKIRLGLFGGSPMPMKKQTEDEPDADATETYNFSSELDTIMNDEEEDDGAGGSGINNPNNDDDDDEDEDEDIEKQISTVKIEKISDGGKNRQSPDVKVTTEPMLNDSSSNIISSTSTLRGSGKWDYDEDTYKKVSTNFSDLFFFKLLSFSPQNNESMPTESETEAANILTTIKSVIREQSPLHSVSTIIPMHDEK